MAQGSYCSPCQKMGPTCGYGLNRRMLPPISVMSSSYRRTCPPGSSFWMSDRIGMPFSYAAARNTPEKVRLTVEPDGMDVMGTSVAVMPEPNARNNAYAEAVGTAAMICEAPAGQTRAAET